MGDSVFPSGTWKLNKNQRQYAASLLEEPRAAAFLGAVPSALKAEVSAFAQLPDPRPATAEKLVEWVAEADSQSVEDIFFAVRNALENALKLADDSAARACEEAAVALWVVAACRVVNLEVAAAAANAGQPWVWRIPTEERFVVAVITISLYGGRFRPLPAIKDNVPQPEYVFEVSLGALPEEKHTYEVIERALFVVAYQHKAFATDAALEAGPLSAREVEQLRGRLGTFRRRRGAALALVVGGLTPAREDVGGAVAAAYEVPIFIPDEQVQKHLLVMNPERLRTAIGEFWLELRHVNRPADERLPTGAEAADASARRNSGRRSKKQVARRSDTSASENAKTKSTRPNAERERAVKIVNYGNVSVAGDHGIAQAGKHNKASPRHGMDAREVRALIEEMNKQKRDSDSERRADLLQQLQIIRRETRKLPKQRNGEAILTALKRLKQWGEGILGAQRINELGVSLAPYFPALEQAIRAFATG